MYLPKNPDTFGEMLREIAFTTGDKDDRRYGYSENLRPEARRWEKDALKRFIGDNLHHLGYYGDRDQKAIDDIAEGIVVEYHAYGATFAFEDVEVDVLAYWDGDGTLLFRVRKSDEALCVVVNHDSKKAYGWERP